MTDNKPNNRSENTRNEQSVHNPKAPGQVERVDPATGGEAGTIDSTDVKR